MYVLLILSVIFGLAGCFGFIHIPSSSVQVWCAGESAKLGGYVKLQDGRIGRVTRVYGRSEACQDADIPIRVDLEFLRP